MRILNFFLIISICQVHAYQETIKTLVKNNPRQLSVIEYTAVAEKVAQRAPCNMLVFGVGADSSLWIDLNKNGLTVFLEDNLIWFNLVKNRLPLIQAYLVSYGTERKDWSQLLAKREKKSLELILPEELLSIKWDIIFVDGPAGDTYQKPGRMKSIFTASVLAFGHNNVDVFVHDCDRIVEKAYTDAFLLPSNLVNSIKKLRHYHIKK